MNSRTLAELAELCGATLEGDPDFLITGPATLAEAESDQVSFLNSERYAQQLAVTRAGCVVVSRDQACDRPGLALLRVDDPNRAFSALVQAFAPSSERPPAGIHPTAIVHPTAELGEGVCIGPHCVIEEGASIAADCVLIARVFVGAGAGIGSNTTLHPGVTLYARVIVGANCILHAGAAIGPDGFGFEHSPTGWERIPQCGTVIIEDDVEVGANTAIDRGRFGATRIGRGTKIDNLVQLGHNCVVGENAMICAQVGTAGTTEIGAWVVIGGQAGLGGHLKVGDGSQVAGQSAVFGDLDPGGVYMGFPARPRAETLKSTALVRRLPKLLQRVQELEKRLARLEEEEA